MCERRILVTGAAGFIGRALTAALLDDPNNAAARIVLVDAQLPVSGATDRVDVIQGDLADPQVIDAAIGDGVDLAFHLASVVGGAAEADYALARRVNVDATLTLFERLRHAARCPRVVFASSIAVFGEPPPPHIDDDTPPRPTMTYGAQKRMMEIALAHFSERSWLDGVSLRLPAVVAKPAIPGIEAVFLNRIFHAFAAGLSITLPVSPDGTVWLLSTNACVRSLIHASELPSTALDGCRTLTLPASRVTMRMLIAALERRYPGSGAEVTFAPDPRIEAQFASQPPLSTPASTRLGFTADDDIDQLVARAATTCV